MKTKTKYFGEIDYEKEELLTFPKGLFGFEEEHSFLLIPFSEGSVLLSLQSVSTPELAFNVMHPFSLDAGYAPVLQADELRELGVSQSEELYYYVMCTVREPVGESTVNMRCPLAINPDTREGLQSILEDSGLGMRCRLDQFRSQGGSSC